MGAQRRKLAHDKVKNIVAVDETPATKIDDRFYDLDGEYLVIFCDGLKTLNIDNIYMEDLDVPVTAVGS